MNDKLNEIKSQQVTKNRSPSSRIKELGNKQNAKVQLFHFSLQYCRGTQQQLIANGSEVCVGQLPVLVREKPQPREERKRRKSILGLA